MEENTQKAENQSTVNETDEHMSEHNYDGIQELDNPPPRWIMAIFYITIGFSIIYAAYYFWLDVGDHQDAKYTRKSELHDARYKLDSEPAGEMGMLTDANLEISQVESSQQPRVVPKTVLFLILGMLFLAIVLLVFVALRAM